MIMIIIITQ